MNFLSSAFSSLTGTSIPYTFKEKVVDGTAAAYPQSRSIWTIYNGTNPKNDTSVSIFEFSLKDPAMARYEGLARNCFRKLKLIKFPGIISIVDYIENDSYLYIVTEQVTPLMRYLTDNDGRVAADAKLYGIHSVAHALLFINMKALCVHGKLDLASSVFVNALGEWKLFGFEVLTNLTSDPDQPIYRLGQYLPAGDENQPDEVVRGGMEAIRQFPIKYDSYRLGVFIYSVLSALDFHSPVVVDQAKVTAGSSKIPRALALPVKRLVNAKGNLRITVDKFLQETDAFFAANPLVQFSKLLEDAKFLSDADKLAFFKNDLAHYVDGEFPPGFLDNKLLPEIISQFNALNSTKPTVNLTPEEHQSRQETISVLLNFILKLSTGLTEQSFSRNIKPVIFQSFTLLDRSVRLSLLKYLPEYSQHLTELEVQSKVFYNLLSGFQDSNFLIRETTLTSIMTVIDKVSVKQVNQDLLKVLAKLQMDPKPSIRTNTVILIIKISGKIYATSRNNVVITALAKSLRDTFTPCKLAALSGFEKLKDEFSLEEICAKILGHLAVALMDNKSYKVRKEAKRIFELYLAAVEKHASSLPQTEEDELSEEKEFYDKVTGSLTAANTSSGSGSLSFGWNMVNKLVSSEAKGELNTSFNASTPDLTRVSTPKLETEVQAELWSEDELLADDQWGGDNDDAVEKVPISSLKVGSGAKQMSFGQNTSSESHARKPPARTSTKSAVQRSGLKLSGKPDRNPGSRLKLNLDVEDEDDSWGGEW